MKRRETFVVAFVALYLAAAHAPDAANAQQTLRNAQRDGVDLISPDDPEMLAAVGRARRTLAAFMAVLDAKKNETNVAVKIPIVDDGNTEYLWVNELSHDGDAFVGTVANDPVVVRNVTFGQRISFSKNRISDWHYVKDGRMRGSFTTCVEFGRLNPCKARRLELKIGLTCDEGA